MGSVFLIWYLILCLVLHIFCFSFANHLLNRWVKRATMCRSLLFPMHWAFLSVLCTLTAAHVILVVSAWIIMISYLLVIFNRLVLGLKGVILSSRCFIALVTMISFTQSNVLTFLVSLTLWSIVALCTVSNLIRTFVVYTLLMLVDRLSRSWLDEIHLKCLSTFTDTNNQNFHLDFSFYITYFGHAFILSGILVHHKVTFLRLLCECDKC